MPTTNPAQREPHVVVNRAPKGFERPDLSVLWTRRELLYFLTWRDVRVRYKQTVLGALWAVLQPVIAALVFTIVFGRVTGLASNDYPYLLFVYTALVPWTFFSSAVTQSANSLVLQERILTRVYFPRLLIPVASIGAVLVDLAATLVVLGVLLAVFAIAPTWTMLTLPAFIVLLLLVSCMVGVWLSAVNVRYRDVRYITPFLIQVLFFATPVAYSSSIVPSSWRWIFELNPMVGVVEGFRYSALGAEAPGRSLATSAVVTIVGLTATLFYFRRLEASFADEV